MIDCRRNHTRTQRTRPLHSLVLLLVGVVLLFACSLAASGQQIRIPLERKQIPAGGHYKSAGSMVAHVAKQFRGPIHHEHEFLSLYADPTRVTQMRNFYNRMYVGSVAIGTPGVPFSLVFDTGSADLWVFAAKSSKPRLAYVTYYDPTKSSTGKQSTAQWSIQYGKGASSGTLVSDHVSLSNLTAKTTFAQAASYSDDFESPDMPLDGILGLAFQEVNSAGVPTLLDNLHAGGLIKERVFSFYFTTDNPSGSEFILGTPDMSMSKGDITYLDLASTSGMWLLSMQAVTIGTTPTSFCAAGSDCAVLLDTGTSFIGMPTSQFNQFAASVAQARSDCMIDSGSGLIRCERDTADGLPSLSFSIQGSLFTLQGSDYYQQGVLGFMPLDVSTPGRSSFWILGDTFLKTYYTVFDMDARKIGIAGAKPGEPYTPPERGGGSNQSTRSWQLIVLIVGCLLGCICISIICTHGLRRSRSQWQYGGGPAGVPQAAVAAPYVLQPAPPIQMQRQYPAAHGYAASQYPGNVPVGQPAMAAYPVVARAPSPRQRRTPNPNRQPQSEFAREFYGAGAV